MKIPITIFFFFFSIFLFSQNCNCENQPNLKNIVSCKKTKFKNGAKLFWSYDCNSSWLTFENGKIRKKIFSLDKNLINLTGRLGFSNWREYKNSFLIENKVISGCCDPSECILFNKNNGNKIENLGTLLFETEPKQKKAFIVTLKNLNTLYFTNLETNKIFITIISKGRLEKSLKNSDCLFAECLFQDATLNKNMFSINYKFKDSKTSKWKTETIKLDTRKYGI